LSDPASGRLNPLSPSPGGSLEDRASRAVTALRALFPALTPEDTALLDSHVGRLLRETPTEPVVGDLLPTLSGPSTERLHTLLEVFQSGSLQAFNGPTTARLDHVPLGFDLSGVNPEHRAFAQTLVLLGLEELLRARPGNKLVVVDEAHLLARHGPTAEYLDRLVRHGRHSGVGLLLLSQNPEDFLRDEPGRSLLRNLRSTLLLRISSVSAEARSFFDLTSSEADWLPRARMPREAGYAEGLLRTGAGHLPLAVVASTAEYEFLQQCLVRPEPR
ncbi:MAG TPA: hypothetical protein VJS68_00575, partial [Thermoplasmata archaeon]|nr:hypothetical protein [Thermoplasmata archaeon]